MKLPPDKIIRSRAEQLGIRPDELKYLIKETGPYVGVPDLTSEERYLLESYRISERGDKNSRDDRRHRSRGDKTRSDRSRGDRSRRYRGKSERQRQRERDIHERNIRDGKEDLLIALNQIDEFRNIPYEIKMEVAYQEWTGDLSVDIEKSKQVLREYLQRTGLTSEPVMAIGVRDPPVVMADHVLEGTPILVHEPELEPELEPEPEHETKPGERDLVAEQMRLGRAAGYPDLPMLAGEDMGAYFRRLKEHYKRLKKQERRRNKSKGCCGSRPRMKKKKKKQTRRRKSKPINKRKPKQTRRYKKMKH
jgi:hypothetical protein